MFSLVGTDVDYKQDYSELFLLLVQRRGQRNTTEFQLENLPKITQIRHILLGHN